MQNLPYLFAAFAIAWLVLFGYLFVVHVQVRGVERELEVLKARLGGAAPGALGDQEGARREELQR